MANKKVIEIGCDISHWNGIVDFVKLKAQGLSFVIIKAGGSDRGFYQDHKFNDNYRLAKLAGMKVGAYYFVGKDFVSAEDGLEDAKRFYHIIRNKDFDYPVFVDIESTSPKDKKGVTDAATSFCNFMEDNKYYASIYASDVSGFKERLETDRLKAFDKWVARYGTNKPDTTCGIWQYSSKGIFDGVNGYLDLDKSYIDYAAIMEKKQLNRG